MRINNTWIGVGRISNDLELKMTETGKRVLNFSVAINDGTKENPHTTFVPVEAWENIADTISKYFKKGDQIIVNGRLVVRKYNDRGENRNKISVALEGFEFGEKKKEEKEERKEYNSAPKTNMYTNDIDANSAFTSGYDEPWR